MLISFFLPASVLRAKNMGSFCVMKQLEQHFWYLMIIQKIIQKKNYKIQKKRCYCIALQNFHTFAILTASPRAQRLSPRSQTHAWFNLSKDTRYWENCTVFDVLLQRRETNMGSLYIAVSGEFNLRAKHTLEPVEIFFHSDGICTRRISVGLIIRTSPAFVSIPRVPAFVV